MTMNSSTFDPNVFLDSIVDVPFETVRTTIPPRDDYIGVIESVRLRTPKGSVILDVYWKLLDENLAAQLNLDTITVRQSLFLDFDEVTGKLASGINNNIQLGQLRDAAGQNSPGVPWKPRMLEGAGPFRLKVTERADATNARVKYNDVASVTRLS